MCVVVVLVQLVVFICVVMGFVIVANKIGWRGSGMGSLVVSTKWIGGGRIAEMVVNVGVMLWNLKSSLSYFALGVLCMCL